MSSVGAREFTFDRRVYHEQLSRLSTPTYRKLNRILKTYQLFNVAFIAIAAFEIILFISLFALLNASLILAYVLGAFFLTLFSYLVLRLYIQAKKPEQLLDLCEQYLMRCKELIRYQEGVPEHHIALSSAASKFAGALSEKEYTSYSSPFFLKSLTPLLEKFSAWCHWQDYYKMREYLLQVAVDEHIRVVKCEPTNLEVHAALANAYVRLSFIYADPYGQEGVDEERWIPKERTSEEMKEKFRKTAERAIEEFKILSDYAPNDPWVHLQLAYSYHDLQMPLQEICEYEIILNLRPNDHDILFQLGVLYFEQGMNAKGLRIYEILKQAHYQKSENLIKFYGSCELS